MELNVDSAQKWFIWKYTCLSDICPTRCNFTQFVYLWKLFYMFKVVSPPIIRSTHNCIYSTWHLSNRYCYLPLLWKSWNWFECGVRIVLICFGVVAAASMELPQHTQTSSNSSTIVAGSSNGLTSDRCSRYSCVLLMMGGDTTQNM